MARHVGRLGAQTAAIRRHRAVVGLRDALRGPERDPARAPGLVRVYRPDGTLKAVLDPLTRRAVTAG